MSFTNNRGETNPLLAKSSKHTSVEANVVRSYLCSSALGITEKSEQILKNFRKENLIPIISTTPRPIVPLLPKRFSVFKDSLTSQTVCKGDTDFANQSLFDRAGFHKIKSEKASKSASSLNTGQCVRNNNQIIMSSSLSLRKISEKVDCMKEPVISLTSLNNSEIDHSAKVSDLMIDNENDNDFGTHFITTKKRKLEATFNFPKTLNCNSNMPPSIPASIENDTIRNQNDNHKISNPYSTTNISISELKTGDLTGTVDASEEKINSDTITQAHANSKKSRTAMPEGIVSDNFVRLNMRNKNGACKGSRKKKLKNDVFRRRLESTRLSSIEQSLDTSMSNDSLQTNPSNPVHGLQGLGLDPLSLSIENYQTICPINDQKHPNQESEKVSIKRNQVYIPSKLKNPMKDKIFLQDIAPKCSGHQFVCKLCTVRKKSSAHKGRFFYACAYPRDQQCKFFLWVEDNPDLPSLVQPKVLENSRDIKTPEKSRTDYLLHHYHKRLVDMSSSQLKAEIAKFNRRRYYCNIRSPSEVKRRLIMTKLRTNGKKDDIIEDLLHLAEKIMEALRFLTCDALNKESLFSINRNSNDLDEMSIHSCDDVDEDIINKSSKSLEFSWSSVSDTDESFESGEEEENKNIEANHAFTSHRIVDHEPNKNSINVMNSDMINTDMPLTTASYNDLLSEVSDDEMIEFSDDESSECIEEQESQIHQNHSKSLRKLSIIDALQLYFGFEGLRNGQEWAIQRSIANQRSLFVAATGAGKSLCFALPAILLPGITIVVSPLISLMEDQARKLPPELPSIVLSGGSSTFAASEFVDQVLNQRVKILFVSPERLCSGPFRNLIQLLNKNSNSQTRSSEVSLLCIDEAHCLSQWSYNFRPSFLGISKALQWLQPQSVLGLTATANPQVQMEIAQHLGINKSSGIMSSSCRRDNLILRATTSRDNDHKLSLIVKLLDSLKQRDDKANTSQKASFRLPNIIIYAWRRYDTETITTFLQAKGYSAACYHAGLSSLQRSKIQQQFESGKLKVIVATVAFGMGIDKSDVNIVIHSYLPSSIEDYMQQTGRAGRDGQLAKCHLFFTEEDCLNQHSIAFSHSYSLLQVLLLLSHVFVNSKRTQNSSRELQLTANSEVQILCQICLSIETLSSTLDIADVSLLTIISILEQQLKDEEITISADQQTYMNKLQGNFRYTNNNASKIIPTDSRYALVQALHSKKTTRDAQLQDHINEEFETTLFELSDMLKMSMEDVIKQLYSLQKQGEIQYNLSDSSVLISVFKNRSTTIVFESELQFSEWIIEKSRRLFSTLQAMNNCNANRVLDTWKIAKTIEKYSAASSECEPSFDQCQEKLRSLLELCMSRQYNSETDVSNPNVDSLGRELESVACPFAESNASKIQNDATVIHHDPDILASVSSMVTELNRQLGVTHHRAYPLDVINQLKRDHIALIAFKIFYGVHHSAQKPESKSIWQGSSFWGKHKNSKSTTVYAACASVGQTSAVS